MKTLTFTIGLQNHIWLDTQSFQNSDTCGVLQIQGHWVFASCLSIYSHCHLYPIYPDDSCTEVRQYHPAEGRRRQSCKLNNTHSCQSHNGTCSYINSNINAFQSLCRAGVVEIHYNICVRYITQCAMFENKQDINTPRINKWQLLFGSQFTPAVHSKLIIKLVNDQYQQQFVNYVFCPKHLRANNTW